MTDRTALIGDRVCFVGLFPRMYETVGQMVDYKAPFAYVRWDSRPERAIPIHPSQIERIPPVVNRRAVPLNQAQAQDTQETT